MPSAEHESITRLFQEDPDFAAELLTDVLHLPLPERGEATVGPNDIDEHQSLRRADAVVVYKTPDGRKAALTVIVEVQRARDRDKPYTWPAYIANARNRLECPTYLLVVAPNKEAANWCAKPIDLGHPGFTLRPLVLGPDVIPSITDPRRAAESPELSVLSAIVHATDPQGVNVLEALLHAMRALPGKHALRYAELVRAALPAEVWNALEKKMKTETREILSDFTRARLAEAREEGRTEGKAEAILTLLSMRGLEVPAHVREAVDSCGDQRRLNAWLLAAATVDRAEDLLD